jgi:hypothetical protein
MAVVMVLLVAMVVYGLAALAVGALDTDRRRRQRAGIPLPAAIPIDRVERRLR